MSLSGCSKKSAGEEGVSQATPDGTKVATTNPPITQKISYDTEEETATKKKKKKKSKKKTLAKRKLSSESERENVPDGDILSFMKKRCKKYGCSGSDSANFYKVLQDTAETYGISIAQAQAAWNGMG